MIADLTDDQKASAVNDACDRQLFCVEQGSCDAEYCLICSTVILPPFTYGINADSEFWLHDDGDCDALTLVIWPFENVTVADKFP